MKTGPYGALVLRRQNDILGAKSLFTTACARASHDDRTFFTVRPRLKRDMFKPYSCRLQCFLASPLSPNGTTKKTSFGHVASFSPQNADWQQLTNARHFSRICGQRHHHLQIHEFQEPSCQCFSSLFVTFASHACHPPTRPGRIPPRPSTPF